MTDQLDSSWSPPPETLTLPSDEVHVWRASLDLPALQLQTLQHTLSADELRRADRFRFQTDREHFIAARSLLRAILGRYLDKDPSQLTFSYGPNGKPALTTTSDEDKLCFNLSRRQGLALYTVTRGRKVGIDLELIRDDLPYEQIAERFFAPRETAALQALPPHTRHESFFTCWTCKEAYIKALGTGLSLPLDRFDVLPSAEEPMVALNIEEDPEEASRWSLRRLSADPGYAAALTVEGHCWRLKCWQWNTSTSSRRSPI